MHVDWQAVTAILAGMASFCTVGIFVVQAIVRKEIDRLRDTYITKSTCAAIDKYSSERYDGLDSRVGRLENHIFHTLG